MVPRRPTLMALLLLAALACSDEGPPPPEAGTVTVRLESPSGAEGAALFEVAGPVTAVAMEGGQAFSRAEGATTRVAMVREVAGALSVEMTVPDIHRPGTLTLLQVSGPDDELRPDLSGYRLEVVR